MECLGVDATKCGGLELLTCGMCQTWIGAYRRTERLGNVWVCVCVCFFPFFFKFFVCDEIVNASYV